MGKEKSLLRITRIYPRKNGRETGRASGQPLGGKISFVKTTRLLIARLMKRMKRFTVLFLEKTYT